MTSSQMNRAPCLLQRSLIPFQVTEAAGRIAPPFTIIGSMITPAIPPRWRSSACSRRSRSFQPQTATSSSTLGGIPGEPATGTGASAGPASFSGGFALMIGLVAPVMIVAFELQNLVPVGEGARQAATPSARPRCGLWRSARPRRRAADRKGAPPARPRVDAALPLSWPFSPARPPRRRSLSSVHAPEWPVRCPSRNRCGRCRRCRRGARPRRGQRKTVPATLA